LASYLQRSPYDRQPLRRRASGLALALGINLLLLLVLLGLGVRPPKPHKTSGTLVFNLPADSESRSAEATTRPKVVHKEVQHTETRPVPKPPPIVLPAKPTIQPDRPLEMIEMSKEDYAAADIGKVPKSSAGAGAGDSEAVGRGPHGEVLYAAEWARHPTDAELSGYLPASAPDGWGLIACRTIPDNRVEDCVELDQSPRGSHLASAVRQAAWQFRVRPPRKNGRPMIGEWVQIRIDYYTVRKGE
jgi:periplasmic protein TonB